MVVNLVQWVWNSYGKKKQCRRVLWRMRAALNSAFKPKPKPRQHFHYDPSSYALNFDDQTSFHPHFAAKSATTTTLPLNHQDAAAAAAALTLQLQQDAIAITNAWVFILLVNKSSSFA